MREKQTTVEGKIHCNLEPVRELQYILHKIKPNFPPQPQSEGTIPHFYLLYIEFSYRKRE